MISGDGIPYILEFPLAGTGEVLKHTNLAGERTACIGSELWFSDSRGLYVSSGSGRCCLPQ